MGYNKSEIARITGLSRQVISRILNGKQKNPRLVTLEKIACTIGCSVEDLINLRKVD